jgi:hypothetical protein
MGSGPSGVFLKRFGCFLKTLNLQRSSPSLHLSRGAEFWQLFLSEVTHYLFKFCAVAARWNCSATFHSRRNRTRRSLICCFSSANKASTL